MSKDIQITYVPLKELKATTYNPRKHSKEKLEQLKESITRFGTVDPLVVNGSPKRKNVVIGGHMRLKVLKELKYKEVPVVYVSIPNEKKEQELNLRLNKNTGNWDMDLLKEFDESFLADIGFASEELDDLFLEESPEMFNLKKELDKLGIKDVEVKQGDIYEIDGSFLMCGDSTVEKDMLTLMGDTKADMVMTDPPYILSYVKGKTKQKDGITTGFGAKKNRVYLGTTHIPDDFTDKWMANVAKVQKDDFSIIVFEHPKNLKLIWTVLEKHWRYRSTITWHVPNRMQGFAGKYKFFNKHDIALVGTGGDVNLNLVEEEPLFQNEYENALFATSGHPHWESYQKNKKHCPTDFIQHIAADEKSSGQGIIFGTKPIELLQPYIKVLTKRDAVVLEPFGGSGSTLIASLSLGRRCFIMEKCPTYAQVIIKRWEKFTGKKAKKVHG